MVVLNSFAVSADPPGGVPPPNIVLITLDTCRADRLGCYGFGLAATPAVDRLAAEGVRCADAVTSAPITLPAHASIFTGLLPPAHGVRDNGAYLLSDDATTLAEALKRTGYETAAFVSALVLNRRYGLAQGFDVYDDNLWSEDEPALFMIRDRPAPRTAARAVAWIETRARSAPPTPFFLWAHFFDPHQPYNAKVRSRHLLPTAYDAEIAQADEGVAAIVDSLERLGVFDATCVVVAADHGESLGEHGERTHGVFIYDATVRVPLIFRYPALLPRGRIFERPVHVFDIAPTLLAMAGGELPNAQGLNLLPALRGDSPLPERAQYSESLLSELGFGMAPLFGVRYRGHKYIRAPQPERYDLAKDGHERFNRYDADPALARELDYELDALVRDSEARALPVRANPLDEETSEALRALGYLAAPAARAETAGMDPKQGIALYNKLEAARHAAQRGDYSGCEGLAREVIAAAPRHVSARNVLGVALLRQNRWADAAQAYADSLAIEPNQARALHALGYARFREGKLEKAERCYRASLEQAPGAVESMIHLGFIEMQQGRPDAARQWYDKALVADPAFPRAHLASADLYYLQGDYSNALQSYERTLEALPDHFAALLQAGLCAMKLERYGDAKAFFTRAGELRPDSWMPPYNLACLSAVTGEADTALRQLGIALDKTDDKSQFARLAAADADLRSIRSRPELRDLLERATGGAR
jgi:arylsulfatase A-like enzyme/Tfp pilus assembly protein PilF